MEENNDEEQIEENSTKRFKNEIKFEEGINIYYNQFKITVFAIFIISFILCSVFAIIFFIIYLNGDDIFIYYSIIPMILLVFIVLLSSFYPLFSKINIDTQKKLITITHIKILFCLNKYLYINFDDIELVSLEKNIKLFNYDAFNLIFKLKKDKKIIGLEGEMDKNFESENLFEFLRTSLPKTIPVSSDLMTINENYPGMKTNRVISSSKTSYININEINKTNEKTALEFE